MFPKSVRTRKKPQIIAHKPASPQEGFQRSGGRTTKLIFCTDIAAHHPVIRPPHYRQQEFTCRKVWQNATLLPHTV
jgi:hypothetical protein